MPNNRAATPIYQDYPLRQAFVDDVQYAGVQYPPEYFAGDAHRNVGSALQYEAAQNRRMVLDQFGRPYYIDATITNGGPSFEGHGAVPSQPYASGGVYASPPQQDNYIQKVANNIYRTPERTDRRNAPRRVSRTHNNGIRKVTPVSKKRNKAAKKVPDEDVYMPGPLSELTAHMNHIPLKDTEAWVTRSVEQRRKEVVDGHAKRPSNVFILYRSAYADRSREYAKSNNHQQVSRVAAASWALEPESIKKRYQDWYNLEKANHAAAFPEYKFRPKTQAAKSKKRKADVLAISEDEDEDDVNDRTYYDKNSNQANKTKKGRITQQVPAYTAPTGEWERQVPVQTSTIYQRRYLNGSQNGQAQVQTVKNQALEYYHGTNHTGMQTPGSESGDMIRYQEVEVPESLYDEALLGLPGSSHTELTEPSGFDNGHLMLSTPTLDPSLITNGMYQAQRYPTQVMNGGHVQFNNEEVWNHFDNELPINH